jgi:hypothetical protein
MPRTSTGPSGQRGSTSTAVSAACSVGGGALQFIEGGRARTQSVHNQQHSDHERDAPGSPSTAAAVLAAAPCSEVHKAQQNNTTTHAYYKARQMDSRTACARSPLAGPYTAGRCPAAVEHGKSDPHINKQHAQHRIAPTATLKHVTTTRRGR